MLLMFVFCVSKIYEYFKMLLGSNNYVQLKTNLETDNS